VLSSPVFVGHAGDGPNRLFIVEQAGIIKVLQPGAPTPTVFLDIRTRVLSGGERGLLGLAFHPQYPSNGREILAYGLRNPWRFSFDRLTGQAWVGDVGQGAREEVDTPLLNGGNYGWRVYEGFLCTNNDPTLCTPSNYILPLFDYSHSGGRCSLTGGYVYRGSQGVVGNGSYVYGDYCSGEIFLWSGGTQSVLLDTT
jgi:hypothetical protein